MAAYGQGIDFSFTAGEDFSNKPWYVVALNSSQEVVVASGASGVRGGPIGIVQENASAGQTVPVRMIGMSKAVVDAGGSSISYGDNLSPVAASPGKLGKHPATKSGSPFAIALGALNSGSARIEVFILGPRNS